MIILYSQHSLELKKADKAAAIKKTDLDLLSAFKIIVCEDAKMVFDWRKHVVWWGSLKVSTTLRPMLVGVFAQTIRWVMVCFLSIFVNTYCYNQTKVQALITWRANVSLILLSSTFSVCIIHFQHLSLFNRSEMFFELEYRALLVWTWPRAQFLACIRVCWDG